MDSGFWARLQKAELKCERYFNIIKDLQRQVRALQQQLADRRSQ